MELFQNEKRRFAINTRLGESNGTRKNTLPLDDDPSKWMTVSRKEAEEVRENQLML